MPRGKKKAAPKKAVEAQQQKVIVQEDIINREPFLAKLESKKFKPIVTNGVVYIHIKRTELDKMDSIMSEMEKYCKEVNYRGSYGVTAANQGGE